MFRQTVGIVFFACWISACATPYQESGVRGGVMAKRISEDTIQVVANGNGFTEVSTIQQYVLRKAAETTISYGYDQFVIVEAQDSSERWRSVGSAANVNYIKPGQKVSIRMLKNGGEASVNSGVFDAKEVLKRLVPGSK
jgi:hypothetical protein